MYRHTRNLLGSQCQRVWATCAGCMGKCTTAAHEIVQVGLDCSKSMKAIYYRRRMKSIHSNTINTRRAIRRWRAHRGKVTVTSTFLKSDITHDIDKQRSLTAPAAAYMFEALPASGSVGALSPTRRQFKLCSKAMSAEELDRMSPGEVRAGSSPGASPKGSIQKQSRQQELCSYGTKFMCFGIILLLVGTASVQKRDVDVRVAAAANGSCEGVAVPLFDVHSMLNAYKYVACVNTVVCLALMDRRTCRPPTKLWCQIVL